MFNKIKDLVWKYREKGWGSCPNCKTNWRRLVDKHPKRRVSGTPIRQEGIPYMPGHGVLICFNCLDNPEKLDPDKIYNNLVESGWQQNQAKLASDAVKKLIPIKVVRKNKLKKLESWIKNETTKLLEI